jgi:hypothetical protein
MQRKDINKEPLAMESIARFMQFICYWDHLGEVNIGDFFPSGEDKQLYNQKREEEHLEMAKMEFDFWQKIQNKNPNSSGARRALSVPIEKTGTPTNALISWETS